MASRVYQVSLRCGLAARVRATSVTYHDELEMIQLENEEGVIVFSCAREELLFLTELEEQTSSTLSRGVLQ